jgi:hypothetical protein
MMFQLANSANTFLSVDPLSLQQSSGTKRLSHGIGRMLLGRGPWGSKVI